MKVREVMSKDPVCCLPTDSAQSVARIMSNRNVGAVPVVADRERRRLVGMITDRDFCCTVVADGLDPKTTTIEKFVSTNPISCRDGENIESCERLMQHYQVRRIPVVDGNQCVIGIVSQADLALHDRPERVSRTLAAISRTDHSTQIAA
jgi:CBS domain-containing protein